MSNTSKYHIWTTININHEYYKNLGCPVLLIPQQKTALFFERNHMIFRKGQKNTWIISTYITDIDKEELSHLTFDLIPQDNIVMYITDYSQNSDKEDYQIGESHSIGKWLTISMPFHMVKNNIKILLKTKSKYWEFVLIPKNMSKNTNLKIQEKQNKLEFKDVERIQYLNFDTVFHVSTQGKITIKEAYNYTIQLTELKNGGERMLCSNLPIPLPNELSILNPYDTITTYFYI